MLKEMIATEKRALLKRIEALALGERAVLHGIEAAAELFSRDSLTLPRNRLARLAKVVLARTYSAEIANTMPLGSATG
jgi:hypothetical protein